MRRARGFTLIELILVLAIVGLAMAVAGVGLSRFSTQSAGQRLASQTQQALQRLRNQALQAHAVVEAELRFDTGVIQLSGPGGDVLVRLPEGARFRPLPPVAQDAERLPLVFFADGTMADSAFALVHPGVRERQFHVWGAAGKIATSDESADGS